MPDHEYTFIIERNDQLGQYRVVFDGKQELVTCSRHKNLFLFETEDGPIFIMREFSKGMYTV
jgi:hypothetical protein